MLPEEYGGALPPMNNQDFSKAMFARDDEFKSDLQYGFQKNKDLAPTTAPGKDPAKERRSDKTDNKKKILSAATTG